MQASGVIVVVGASVVGIAADVVDDVVGARLGVVEDADGGDAVVATAVPGTVVLGKGTVVAGALASSGPPQAATSIDAATANAIDSRLMT